MKNYTCKVLFLGCNYDQVPYLKEIKKKGYFIVGTDLNPEAPGKALCDKFYQVGYDNFDGLIEIGEKEKFNKDDKIFTAGAQFAHLGASKVAHEFKIPYPPIHSIEICLDKVKFYSFFQQNQLPIPGTYFITNKQELKEIIREIGINKTFYLKSDFSKNPNYVYRFKGNQIEQTDIFWGKDRYLQNYYILQEEFAGEHLRINIINNDFIVFPVDLNSKLNVTKEEIFDRGIIKKLRVVVDALGFSRWLVKFDIIFGEKDYVVLDIGIDPPFRLNKYYLKKNLNFPEYYVNQYLTSIVNYPILSYVS